MSTNQNTGTIKVSDANVNDCLDIITSKFQSACLVNYKKNQKQTKTNKV